MMFCFLRVAAVLCLSISCLCAEVFFIPEVGVSLRTPDGWAHEQEDKFGFVLVPPATPIADKEIRKIRIHIPAQAADLAAQLEQSIESGTKSAPAWGSAADRKRFLGSQAVKTKSGLEGLKGEFGYKDPKSGSPRTINKYFFRNGKGKIFCVCAYVFGDTALADQYEEIILNGLTLQK